MKINLNAVNSRPEPISSMIMDMVDVVKNAIYDASMSWHRNN